MGKTLFSKRSREIILGKSEWPVFQKTSVRSLVGELELKLARRERMGEALA